MTQEDRLNEIHAFERAEFDAIQAATCDRREQSLEDRRFYTIAGAMWEGRLGEQFENRIKLEVNKIHLSIIRLFNEYRNNRITVDFTPKDGGSDDLADLCDGLYRADAQDSSAEEALDNAFEEGVGGGEGAWRLMAQYEDDGDPENDRQVIRIEPIFDADITVFWDLNAKKQDKSDAKVCFVLTPMTVDAFKDEWDEDPTTWPKDTYTTPTFNWCPANTVYVAEVYRVEEKREAILIYTDIDGKEERYTEAAFDEDTTLSAKLEAIGTKFERKRYVTKRRVRKYIMTGNKVLSDEGYIPGTEIPIVPFYAKRWFIEGVEHCMGHVRHAKDSQRLKNMQISELAEQAASTPREKPIFTPQQVLGHENRWASDNVDNYAYMLVNELEDADGNMVLSGPLGYTKPATVSQAMAALLQITEQDISDILGNQERGEEMQPNVSGKAVELVQNRLDMQSFIYMSNMKKAVKRSGEIWLSMAQELYVEDGRAMKSIGAQGEKTTVKLNERKEFNKDTGMVEVKHDLSRAKLEVSATVGPSSQSKRSAIVRALTGMMQITSDPETQVVLGSLALMNMEGEGIQDVREWNRKKLVAMGVMEPTEDDIAEQKAAAESAPPDPNAELMQAAAREADAKARKAEADADLSDARVGETRADTIKTLSEVEQAERASAITAAQALAPAPQPIRPTAQPGTNG